MAAGDGFALFESKVSVKVSVMPNAAAFDWASILKILVSIISGCLKPTPSAIRRKFGNRGRLALAIRQDQPEMAFSDAFVAADHCFDMARDSTDAECQLFIADCHGA